MTDFGFALNANDLAQAKPGLILVPEQQHDADMILHMASFSNMLVLVTGPSGSGKTTLALEMISRHANSENCLFITADVMLGMPSLLRRIGDMSSLSLPNDRQQAIAVLKTNAQKRFANGEKILVIIDNADQLDTDTLNEIAHLALLIPEGLSFTLFGQTGFEQSLRGGPAQAKVHMLRVDALNEDNARQLLTQVYSPNQALAISESEFSALYKAAQGLPAALLSLAGDHFARTAPSAPSARNGSPKAPKEAKSAFKFPLTHLLALGFLALALMLSYFYNPGSDEAAPAPAMKVETVDVLRSLPMPEEPNPFLEPAPASAPAPAPVTPEPAVAQEDFNYDGELASTPMDTVSEPQVATVAPEAPAAALKPSTPKPSALKAQASKASSLATGDAAKLQAIKAGFVVQIFGSYEKANAQKFKQQWQKSIKGELYLYETRHQNKDWFVVVAGVYPNRQAAQASVEAWPAALRKQAPWIRDIEAVQESLR